MTVIYLNGTTSAGKTSLGKALQNLLPGAWLRIGIDDGFALLGSRFHDHRDGFWFDATPAGLVRLNLGPAGIAALAAYRRAAAAMALGGADVIIDDVLLQHDFAADWDRLLDAVLVVKVSVHCNLAELERRERARGDRVIGQARGQVGFVHEFTAYDIEVDTGEMPIDACAERIADHLAAR